MQKTCQYCGKEYEDRPSRRVKYCSRQCAWADHNVKIECICEQCGKHFYVVKSKSIGRKYCSQECTGIASNTHIELVCQNCGKLFKEKAYRIGAKYCSSKCYGEAKSRRMDCKCLVCGKPFTRSASRTKYGFGKYCSVECRNKAGFRQVERSCAVCGKSFMRRPSVATENLGIYCSNECKLVGMTTHVFQECLHCHKTFKVYKHLIGLKKYCSKECYGASQRGMNRGALSIFWRGGRKPYRGPNWRYQRELAYNRDLGICQNCGAVKSTNGYACSVHHIKPFREFDGNYIAANDLLNLITLCSTCHGLAEHGKIILQPKLL